MHDFNAFKRYISDRISVCSFHPFSVRFRPLHLCDRCVTVTVTVCDCDSVSVSLSVTVSCQTQCQCVTGHRSQAQTHTVTQTDTVKVTHDTVSATAPVTDSVTVSASG